LLSLTAEIPMFEPKTGYLAQFMPHAVPAIGNFLPRNRARSSLKLQTSEHTGLGHGEAKNR
jgi:hypothetical protein